MNRIVPNGEAARRTKEGAARDDSPWYRLEDMMRLFDVSARTVWTWTAAGKLPQPRRKGRRWTRWPKDEIDALLVRWGKAG